jgi:ribose transport system substrate-binding protein
MSSDARRVLPAHNALVESQVAARLGDPMTRSAFIKLAGAAGATSLLALAGCGSSGPKTAASSTSGSSAIQRGPITNQITTLANDYFVEWTDGVKQCAAALGLSLETVTDQGVASTDLAQVADVHSTGGKLMFGTVATAGILPAVARACETAGIYYSDLFELPPWFTPLDVGNHYVAFYVQNDNLTSYTIATMLFKAMGGKGTFIHVPGTPGNASDLHRTQGLLKAMKAFPQIKRFVAAPGDFTASTAASSFANAVQSVPDYGGIFSASDAQIIGIQSVIDERSLPTKPMVGIDGDEQNIRYITQGKQLVSAATLPAVDASFAAVAVFDALNGWRPKTCERMMFIPSMIITKKNATQYLDTFFASTKLPFDWVRMSRVLSGKNWNPQAALTPIDPSQYWAGLAKQYPYNPAYGRAVASGEFEQVKAMYANAYTSGPFKAFGA